MIRSRYTWAPALGTLLCLVAAAGSATPITPASSAWIEGAGVPAVVRVFDRRVEETLDLPTWELQQARRRMLAGERISWGDMRSLADHGDGLAAFRFARRIEEQGDPALLSDAAFYYATAAFTNRDYAVGPLIRILDRRDVEFSRARLDHIENALRAMALAGDAKATEALGRFYAAGHPFGRQPEKALEFRLDLAEGGDTDSAMALVLEAMSGTSSVPLDEEQIVRLLDVVAASDDLGIRTTGANLRRMFEAGAVQVRPVARPLPDAASIREESAE